MPWTKDIAPTASLRVQPRNPIAQHAQNECANIHIEHLNGIHLVRLQKNKMPRSHSYTSSNILEIESTTIHRLTVYILQCIRLCYIHWVAKSIECIPLRERTTWIISDPHFWYYMNVVYRRYVYSKQNRSFAVSSASYAFLFPLLSFPLPLIVSFFFRFGPFHSNYSLRLSRFSTTQSQTIMSSLE